MTKWRMSFACSMIKATDTHSEYVMLIAFPLQQWLRQCVSLLRYTYIACTVGKTLGWDVERRIRHYVFIFATLNLFSVFLFF